MSLVRCYFFFYFRHCRPISGLGWGAGKKQWNSFSSHITEWSPIGHSHRDPSISNSLGWCWEFDSGFRPGITNKFNSGHLKIQLTYWVFVSAWFITQLPWVWISVSRTHFQPWRLQENRIAIFMIQIGGIQDVLSVNRREPFLRSQAFVFERVC